MDTYDFAESLGRRASVRLYAKQTAAQNQTGDKTSAIHATQDTTPEATPTAQPLRGVSKKRKRDPEQSPNTNPGGASSRTRKRKLDQASDAATSPKRQKATPPTPATTGPAGVYATPRSASPDNITLAVKNRTPVWSGLESGNSSPLSSAPSSEALDDVLHRSLPTAGTNTEGLERSAPSPVEQHVPADTEHSTAVTLDSPVPMDGVETDNNVLPNDESSKASSVTPSDPGQQGVLSGLALDEVNASLTPGLTPESQAEAEENVATKFTPKQRAGKISQLLTPPASVQSSCTSEASALGSERPERERKQPELFGDLVSTTSSISPFTEASSAEGTDAQQQVEHDDEAIEGAQAKTPTEPETAPPRKRGRPPGTKTKRPIHTETKQPALRRPKTLALDVSRVTKPQVAKSRPCSRSRKSVVADEPTATASRGGRRRKAEPKQANPSQIIKSITNTAPANGETHSLMITLPYLPPPDPQKLALSQKMTARQPLESKPQPRGQPEVWAESRQALCETLSYFKKPQGGCYQNDGHVYGFLFDSVGHCREYMDDSVIICRAGGAMESDGAGGMVQRKDQSIQDSQVQAVLNDIAHQNPVIVICGDRNGEALCKMPHQYCVLGWYKPVAVWSEKTAGKGSKVWTTVKYRLERLNGQEPAWHSLEGPLHSKEDSDIAGELSDETCAHCKKKYPQVYLRYWMCLNQACPLFWKVKGQDAPYGSNGLEYNPAFLLHRSAPWASDAENHELEPAPLRPALPNFGHAVGDNLTYINTRGICCPDCGRCNSRRLFSGWVCESCGFRLPAVHQPVLPAMLHTPWDAAPTLVRNRHVPQVGVEVEHKCGYKISAYTFSEFGVEGRFIHAAATKKMVQEENGADDMFRELQVQDLGLERRAFAVKKMSVGRDDKNPAAPQQPSSSTLNQPVSTTNDALADLEPDDDTSAEKKAEFAEGDLMTAFSMNYGMPYKFVASGASKSFDDGPETVREARRRLNWAAEAFLNKPEEDIDLNEELIFAYLQGQKIEYHDDGEKGLGPRIATLSLGGRAKMHMRMKMKHHVGCSKTGVFTDEKPRPGGIAYEKRLEAWQDLQSLREDSAAYNRRRKEIPKEIGIFEKRNKKADDLVTVTLSHGDIILMDGYDIQKFLEHKVVPEDHLRFALTCRTVLKNHLKAEELPGYEVKVDAQKYRPSV